MIKETKKTMIGGFVIGALTLVIAAILIFGSGDFLKKKKGMCFILKILSKD